MIRLLQPSVSVLILSSYSTAASAFYYCIQRSAPVEIHSKECPGVVIPEYKTRNFTGEFLRCSEASHEYARQQTPYDEEAWQDLKNIDRAKAAAFLRTLPEPAWSETISYPINLHWCWQDCELVTSEQHCGAIFFCDDRNCTTIALTCFADITYCGKENCGQGQLDFNVKYIRKDDRWWHPGHKNYVDILANGYDLLPGEKETITVSNLKTSWWSGNQSEKLSPTLSIEDPRNEYSSGMTINGKQADSLACRLNGYDNVSFSIYTYKRITSASPNAFSLPTAFDNTEIEPLIWQSTTGNNGQRVAKGYPLILRAQDYSAATMSEMSEDLSTRLKSIIVRVQLYESSIFGEKLKSTIYIDEARAIQQTLNAISSDQKIRRSTLWEFKLKNGAHPDKNIYRNFIPALFYYPGKVFLADEELSYDDHLAPDTEYTLKLTVYQKNFPFYLQSCDSDPDAWDCKWYTLWGLFNMNRYERNYFSKRSLDVQFRTNPNVDNRTWLSTFWHTLGWAQAIAPIGTAVIILKYLGFWF
ncbi:hypothetical protein [Endozoicomonas sp. SESOKO1]|uniref:hypothetical protein n=1 Tax=Endozoicomonas sp. SESOKO1 TaxID=2828742 RepID=UPI002148D30E|nr:hypothetical protein [Endozoicomonas sp. SESOKO1]